MKRTTTATWFAHVLLAELQQADIRRTGTTQGRETVTMTTADALACIAALKDDDLTDNELEEKARQWGLGAFHQRLLARYTRQEQASEVDPLDTKEQPWTVEQVVTATFPERPIEEASVDDQNRARKKADRQTNRELFSQAREVLLCSTQKEKRDALIKEVSNAEEMPENNSKEIDAKDQKRRELTNQAKALARDMELTGLAFSGGGIRSATFNLGILQGLADVGLLKRFDYLSTVSGGGYIGSWLTSWIKREGRLETVEMQLRGKRTDQAKGREKSTEPVKEEPEPIFHLRSYSNYLAPRIGISSPDGWILLALYFRNLLLNQLVILPVLFALVVLPRFGLLFLDWDGMYRAPDPPPWWASLPWWLTAFCALTSILICLYGIQQAEANFATTDAATAADPQISVSSRLAHLKWVVLLPMVVGSFLFSWLVWNAMHYGEDFQDWMIENQPSIWLYGTGGVDQREVQGQLILLSSLVFGAALAALLGMVRLVFELSSPKLRTNLQGMPRWNLRSLALAVYWRPWKQIGLRAISATIAGGVVGMLLGSLFEGTYLIDESRHLLVGGEDQTTLDSQAFELALYLTLGTPTVLLLFVLYVILYVGFMSRWLHEEEREWWGSLNGWIMSNAALWAGYCGLALFGAPLLLWFGPLARTTISASWAFTTIAGVLAGSSPRTGSAKRNRLVEWLALAAPYVFVGGLAIGVSWLVSQILDYRPDEKVVARMVGNKQIPAAPLTAVTKTDSDKTGKETVHKTEYTLEPDPAKIASFRYWSGLLNGKPVIAGPGDLRGKEERRNGVVLLKLLLWVGCFLALSALASWRIGVNTFSLHSLYGNRLVRCYLGATRIKSEVQTDALHGAPSNSGRPPRRPNPVTGFDRRDDFPLCHLRLSPAQVPLSPQAQARPYRGPYHLVNTALNLVQGDELAWQERKAEAFVMSPLYCGSEGTGYRDTEKFAGKISLGTAVTVSGAAASPNMGFHSSPAVTALLTMFNVRLGGWFGNPNDEPKVVTAAWENAEPRFSLVHLFNELFGRTNRRSRYVYLSDGGHFENLGAYELVRRHVQLVVICDAGADAGFELEDLGNLIRKCRTDLGVPIELDVTPLKPDSEGLSKWHCAVGRIRYDHVDPSAVPGTLIYLKLTLTGNEPSDLVSYATRCPPFPHHSTLDQFFNESQFESYRALGHHVALEVFSDAMRDTILDPSISSGPDDMSDLAHRQIGRRLTANLQRRWFPPPPELQEGYLESVEWSEKLHEDLASEPSLGQLSKSLYPELSSALDVPSSQQTRIRAELHTLARILQALENALISVQLEGFHAHPLNRGRLNVFRRWMNSEAMRRHWPILRGEFSQDFVRFCESELHMDPGQPQIYSFVNPHELMAEPTWRPLQREFNAEWPSELSLDEIAAAAQNRWLLANVPHNDPNPGPWSSQRYPCGFASLRQTATATTTAPATYELLFWVRGPYRTLGIGRRCLNELLPDILRLPQMAIGSTLRVRLPGGAWVGTSERLQRDLWVAFFFQYGFRKRPQPASADIILELTV